MGKGHCRISIFIYCPRKFKTSWGINILLLLAAQHNYQCSHCVVSRTRVLQNGYGPSLCSAARARLWKTLDTATVTAIIIDPFWLSCAFHFFLNFEANTTLSVHIWACELLTEDKVLNTQQVQGTESSWERLKYLIKGHILVNISWKVSEQNS